MSTERPYLASISLLSLTILSGAVLLSANSSAETITKSASINVPGSCTMTSTGSTSHTAHIVNGIYTPNIGTTTMNVVCNDINGFSIYAVGFTGDEIGTTNSTRLVGTAASSYATIETGTATSAGDPDVSNWAMKLATDSQATYPISITTGYDAYHVVPSEYTKVATRLSSTDSGESAEGSNLTSTYAVYTSATQAPDTYTGQVKYTLVHPNDAPAPSPTSATLYNTIAAAWASEGSRVLTNDTDANTGIQAAITTSNSGVFKYNPSTFGTASDAANTSDIYFYRGILDTTVGSYGSDGDNAAHPNTVVLSSASSKGNLTTSDTCWRIVRTTGSGGVKMIYQGKWTGSTCANAQDNAQVTTNTFSVDSSKYYSSAFGYTQNGSYNSSNLSATYSTMFGSNTSYSANSTDSGIKAYIENTWFTSINSFASKLEPSAGYCNDRTLNSDASWTTPMSDSTTVSTSTTYNPGAYIRNMTATLPPSLTCSRSGADLYTTSSASNGNKQLSKPAALITADEASFAGSGRSNASLGSSYHANSFLRSGSIFWLLSPGYRISNGRAYGFYLFSSGFLDRYYVSNSYGVRPAISLISGTTAVSGTGTAADPWIVNP